MNLRWGAGAGGKNQYLDVQALEMQKLAFYFRALLDSSSVRTGRALATSIRPRP